MNINDLKKEYCSGCQLCKSVCPVKAISFKENSEGFSFPIIDNKLCINCGLCARKCPRLSEKHNVEDGNICYVVSCVDKIRDQCSSGGVFKALADYVLRKHGYVCGAAFNKDFSKVEHTIIKSKKDLGKLLTSKYVQSDVNDVYQNIKLLLDKKKIVLFAGTPCQVDALKTFLGKKYDKLLTVDILCHGVPSPSALRKFITEYNPEKKQITNINFRSKDKGWGTLFKISFADGSSVYEDPHGKYMDAFLSGINMREACYSCPYASNKRVGDITIGDFWGVPKQYNDNKGVSIVFAHNEKGVSFLTKSLKRKTVNFFEQFPYSEALEICRRTNGAFVKPTDRHAGRQIFFHHIKKDTFEKSLRYAKKNIMDIGILGWWIHGPNSNYGSTLTAYALDQYLSSLGLSTAFISPPNFNRDNAGSFNKKYNYRMTAMYSKEDMWKNNQFFDGYIVGSDVLWFYDAMMASAGYNFMLDFAGSDKRKISYSTSFGNPKYCFPDNAIPYARKLLSRFDNIAVREFSAVNILKDRFGIESTQVVDPVFLCDMDVWNKLANNAERKPQGDFVFSYFLDPTEDKINSFKELARQLNVRPISTTDRQYKVDEKKAMLKECGFMENISTEEIVYLMMHAKYIMTDSFHGTCFSLIFNRDFIAFPNIFRDTTRFDTLETMFGIESNIFREQRVCDSFPSIDYQVVNLRIKENVERSKKWLNNALFSPLKKKEE